MRYTLAFIAALLLMGHATAQTTPPGQKGPHGAQMEDVAGIDAELQTSGSTLTLNIYDEDKKPVPTNGFTAAALVVSGADREAVTLVPFGDNSMKGDTKKPIAPGAAITVTLKTADGKSGQAHYQK